MFQVGLLPKRRPWGRGPVYLFMPGFPPPGRYLVLKAFNKYLLEGQKEVQDTQRRETEAWVVPQYPSATLDLVAVAPSPPSGCVSRSPAGTQLH